MKTAFHLLLAAILLVGSVSLASAAGGVFITNPTGPDSLTKADIKNILLGNKTKWDSGGLVKLAVLSQGPVHESIVQEYTARSADQFDKYWKKQVFTGKGSSPDSFKTDAELVAFVAKTPGAFGYIAGDAKPDGVKVISVQ